MSTAELDVFSYFWGEEIEKSDFEQDFTRESDGVVTVAESSAVVDHYSSIQREWMNIFSAIPSLMGGLFGHGGAFCAHCVTGIGQMANASPMMLIPQLGSNGGHYHADGSYHSASHTHDKHSILKPSKKLSHPKVAPRQLSVRRQMSKFHCFSLPPATISMGVWFSCVFCGNLEAPNPA